MMISTKPISSPSRTEKYPPPLMMKFLRTNPGSRSRGRSRSSPMFIRKKNTTVFESQQEPSSPKVTCIGQVRVRRSSNKPCSNRAPCSCLWLRNTLFSHHFLKKLQPKSFRPFRRKWDLVFRFGCCRTGEIGDQSNRKSKNIEDESDDEDELEAHVKVAALNLSSPPKNALLLTRCRSAPYRSSSLASQFWGSPLEAASETEEGCEENRALQHLQQMENREVSESEVNCGESEGKLRFSRENEGSINGKFKEESDIGEVETGGAVILLRRCKSEPARRGERLNLEASFWRHRRLGFAEPCSPHACDKLIN
ncbi:hypothetical protein LOK49_LG10G01795 [Camellia lanceoleosa]|uniref:Uncharacterized protein n=1 Tax=Camellia lanceoleosa TaxID=1840588 RepID=A0ACC0GAQ3_9ERIC|nr:hypothetical protein LOK49_LG10G01795 [Camellia lanceoleosa]